MFAYPRNLDEEIRLYANSKERDKYQNMADLYAILVLLEHLEKAYILRDSISADEYTPACLQLIGKYKAALALVTSDMFTDLDTFMKDYKLECPAAASRLKVGVPATHEHATTASSDNSKLAIYVGETVHLFINLLDLLKLRMYAKDQLHPALSELIQMINKVGALPSNYEGRAKIVHWLVTTNAMKASEELSEDQARQMHFDIEQAYREFFDALGGDKQ